MLPSRLTPDELAELWQLTKTRVLQFVREGKLRRGADGKIDTKEALAFRALQAVTFRGQVLHQTYGNRFQSGDRAAPTKAQVIAEAEVEFDPLALDTDFEEGFDPLAEDTPVVPVFVDPPAVSSMSEVLAQGNELNALKIERARVDLDRNRLRKLKEEGELISRAVVFREGRAAGKLVTSMLRSLPSEIAALFSDPETRVEVRQKVQDRVDKVQHAISVALTKAAGEEAEDE